MSKPCFEEVRHRLRDGDQMSLELRTERYLEILKACGEERIMGFYPAIESPEGDDKPSRRLQALELYMQSMWYDAFWCYVHGSYPACVLLAASSLEGALKYKLYQVIKDGKIRKYLTLDRCIKRSMAKGILPSDKNHRIIRAASRVQRIRDGLVHSNRERWHPEIALYGTPREHEVTGSPKDVQIIEEYKKGARMSLVHTGRVIGYLFPKARGDEKRPTV